MQNPFERSGSSSFFSALMWGAAGAVVGAAATALLTPKTGVELRKLIATLIGRSPQELEQIERQQAAMENEGGVAHVVSPPSGNEARAH